MKTYYKDKAVVLKTYRLGETDRIVVMATELHGKVRAVAKGIRKVTSRFTSRLEPLSHVSLMCWQGKDLDVVTQVETIDNFRICREDFSRMVKAMSMLEVVDHFQQERMADPGVYKMLIGALGALTKADAPLIMPAFFLKLLALEGYSPKVDCCIRCSAKELLVGFDFESAGLLCKRCLEVESSSDNVNGYGPRRKTTPLSSGAVQLVSAILGTGLGWALNCATGTLADEVAYLATRAVEHHLGRPVRSLSFVKELVI